MLLPLSLSILHPIIGMLHGWFLFLPRYKRWTYSISVSYITFTVYRHPKTSEKQLIQSINELFQWPRRKSSDFIRLVQKCSVNVIEFSQLRNSLRMSTRITVSSFNPVSTSAVWETPIQLIVNNMKISFSCKHIAIICHVDRW